MTASINKVFLLGEIGRDGVEMRWSERGTACTSFVLVLNELGSDGKRHQTWVPCEIWGKGAERAGALEAGQHILFEGKLRRQKRGETWETVIAGFEVTPLA